MYVGHLGVALGAKRFAPSVALAALVFATYLPDWIDASLCVTGRYHDAQMLSHSIPAALALAALAGIALSVRGNREALVIVAAIVVSHVLLDYITGIKPTWPGGPFIGLQMYGHPVADFFIESIVIVSGWTLYNRTVGPSQGRWNLSVVLLILLLAMQAAVDALRLLAPSINKC